MYRMDQVIGLLVNLLALVDHKAQREITSVGIKAENNAMENLVKQL